MTDVLSSTNRKTSYFKFDLQTENSKTVQLLCYSPKKRKPLQTPYTNKVPIKVKAKLNKKRLLSTTDEYTLDKDTEVELSDKLSFDFNPKLDDHLHSVAQSLKANIYTVIDLKVKVIMKNENKQSILVEGQPTYNCDTLVADETECIKLVLWENKIDEVHAGKSYHFQNVTIRMFDDDKFINTNQSTIIKEIDAISNINLENPHIKDNIITGKIIGVNVKKTTCCVACNKELMSENDDDEIYTCTNKYCAIKSLLSLCNTKVVAQLVLKTEKEIATYVAFNDGLLSFLSKINHQVSSLTQLDMNVLEKMLLTSKEQKMIADKSSKIICQFL